MGVFEILVVLFIVSIFVALIGMFTYVLTTNRKLMKHTCAYCRAPISPRADMCPTCGEPVASTTS